MCDFCEPENQKRENLLSDEDGNPLMIWTEGKKNTLLLDNGEENNEIEINFCPICGSKLYK